MSESKISSGCKMLCGATPKNVIILMNYTIHDIYTKKTFFSRYTPFILNFWLSQSHKMESFTEKDIQVFKRHVKPI